MTDAEKERAFNYARLYDKDNIAIDPPIEFSEGSSGCWVRAWVFVPREEYKDDEDEDEDEDEDDET